MAAEPQKDCPFSPRKPKRKLGNDITNVPSSVDTATQVDFVLTISPENTTRLILPLEHVSKDLTSKVIGITNNATVKIHVVRPLDNDVNHTHRIYSAYISQNDKVIYAKCDLRTSYWNLDGIKKYYDNGTGTPVRKNTVSIRDTYGKYIDFAKLPLSESKQDTSTKRNKTEDSNNQSSNAFNGEWAEQKASPSLMFKSVNKSLTSRIVPNLKESPTLKIS